MDGLISDIVNEKCSTMNTDWRSPPVYCSLFAVPAAALCVFASSLRGQIQDNSFLLEEAYNQERGVVQHISAFSRASGGDWAYSFTQEWPLGGIRHQFSYTIPLQGAEGAGTGLGDIGLNYRYQLLGDPQARVVVAPRLTLLLPTGREEVGRGNGAVGFQGNLPLTLVIGSQLAIHWNAGATVIPSARDALGNQATATGFNLGASAIWLLRPTFNLLVETLWLSDEAVVGDGQTVREDSWVVSPGFRWALNLAGDLQIVPGAAYTIALDPAGAEDALFLYLSFEHPFKR
jgi:outer membrane putative beta-barrel porin/alpha-amylase